MKNIFILYLLLSPFVSLTQNPKIDSLNQVLRAAKEDTNKLKTLNALGDEYLIRRDFEMIPKYTGENIILANKLLSYAEKGNAVWLAAKKAQQRSFYQIGIMHYHQGNYSESIENHYKSRKISEELKDTISIGKTYINLGNIYMSQGNGPKALDNFFSGLRIMEKFDQKLDIAKAYISIGGVYSMLNTTPEARQYYHRALKIMQELGDEQGEAHIYLNLGNSSGNMGEFNESLKQYFEALRIYEKLGIKNGIATADLNIGDTYTYLGNTTEALPYLTKALYLNTEIGDKKGIAVASIYLGNVYLKLKNYALSRKYFTNGLELSKEIESLKYVMEAYVGLTAVDEQTGNWKAAFENHQLVIMHKDSLLNEESSNKMVKLQMQYEFDKKEVKTKAEQEKKDVVATQELKRQKLMRNGFMSGFTIVLLFAGVFFVQRNRIGKEKKRSEELLLNILPEEVAEELKEKGHSDAQLIDEVTVLFTDFKGFTDLSERVTPKALVADLHEYFSAFDNICETYGIEKIKTIGDAYMAAGGLPTPNTTHAKDVVKAALEMAEVIEKGKAERIAANLPYFEVRIGVHTGPVVAGIVGVKKFQYDIWGDTVNTASRMESSGEVGKVNVSENTFELLKFENDLSFEPRGKIEAKGKGKMDMYFVFKNGNSLA
ncbi:adenylate/guanylate cyclase domain-containing protein [Gaetbulibacter aquiaggeris]|uniref:Adenylate/guanylate cyclase domain-containing protein n=1 Tax=Gaetbulibacter aquiaggeris TaxID=1735373 RepID=A0ABW7MNG3_9FLAO